MPEIIRNGVINDAVAGVPLVIAVGPGRTLIAYQRPDSSHMFEQVDRVRMRGAGSTWKINAGEAVDGDLKGQTLCRVSDIAPMFWKAWQDFHTDTKVSGDWTPE
jgi:hypothetical protein